MGGDESGTGMARRALFATGPAAGPLPGAPAAVTRPILLGRAR